MFKGKEYLKLVAKYNKVITSFLLLVIGYIVLVVGLPPDPATLSRYGLSATEARLLTLTYALPYVVIWAAALYSYIRFKEYAHRIDGSKESASFEILAKALKILAFGMPLVALVRVVLNYYARSNAEFMPTATIITNYFSLAVFLLSFMLLHQGAKKLVASAKAAPRLPHYVSFLLGFVILSSVYAFLVLSNPTRAIADSDTAKAIYYLPDWLLILTIIVPYVYTWFLGFTAAMYIYVFHKAVQGILYRRALLYISVGLSAIIAASVFNQFLTSILNIVLNLRLSSLLGVIYLFLLVFGVGYILTALGARRLQKIEEV